jgi:hypothetical protein
VATVSRPRSGRDNLQYFADLQRQVAGRVAPLRTRERQRHRAHVRRVLVRTVLVLVPLLVALLLVVDAGGSRTWVGDRWQDLTRSATAGDEQPPGSP